MSRIWMPGAGAGPDLDVITAGEGDILAGKVIVGPDGEPLTGILTLTGTAADSQVLSGKTYYNTDAKAKRTGTMVNRGAAAPPGLDAGGSYTIPEGYHNGSGRVTANSLASQTDSNAVAGDILSSKTAWVKGSKVTGTMASRPNAQAASKMAFWSDNNLYLGFPQGAYLTNDKDLGVPTVKVAWQDKTVSPGASQATVSPDANKVLRNVTVNAVSGLSAGNIKQGATVGGVAGNFTNDANAAAGDILSGKTAYVKGSKVTGTMANHTSPDHIQYRRLNNNQYQVAVSAGKHNCNWQNGATSYEYVTYAECAGDIGLTAAKLAKGQTVLGVAGTYTSDANATASQILKDKTAYVNGSKVTGNIASLAGGTYTPGTSQQTISCSGKYMTGNIVIKSVVGSY